MTTSILLRPFVTGLTAISVLLGSPVFSPVLRADDAQAYRWSVEYLIDQSRSVLGLQQRIYPRHNRGLAASPDGRFLYATYHHSHNWSGELRKIDLDALDTDTSQNYGAATKAVMRGILCKAVAVDDKGRVYIAVSQGSSGVDSAKEPVGQFSALPYAARRAGGNEDFSSAILVCDANLRQIQKEIEMEDCEGVAVTREGGSLVLYATERESLVLKRWKLTEKGDKVTDAVQEGLKNDGEMTIPDAKSLRQVFIDSKGRIWISDTEANLVHRVEANRKDVKSAAVNKAMGIAQEDGRFLVTRWTEREITILNDDMKLVGTLSVPWEELELSPVGNNRNGALSGIVVIPGKGFYVSNERGQTANQKSTYGVEDNQSGDIGTAENKRHYKDCRRDDNDPILHAAPVSAVAP
jgi:hypothetical protein